MADVAADLKTWSTTASSNTPAGGTAVGTGVAPNLRELQKVVRQDLAHKGNDIASASSTDIGAVAGLMHDITGTTTITGFGTVSAGIWKILKFEDALTLTHNSTSLILPGGASITTANGDIGIFISEGSGNWRCVSFARAAAQPAQAASDTVAGVIEYAIQSEMETGSSTTLAVTPGRQHFHPSASKFWVEWTSDGTIAASYNMTSVTDSGTGDWTLTIATDFSGTFYSVVATPLYTTAGGMLVVNGIAAGTVTINAYDTLATGTKHDLGSTYFAVGFGDQA